ncbi:hypothetical protein ES702_00199 [subsurface metagenome]
MDGTVMHCVHCVHFLVECSAFVLRVFSDTMMFVALNDCLSESSLLYDSLL